MIILWKANGVGILHCSGSSKTSHNCILIWQMHEYLTNTWIFDKHDHNHKKSLKKVIYLFTIQGEEIGKHNNQLLVSSVSLDKTDQYSITITITDNFP